MEKSCDHSHDVFIPNRVFKLGISLNLLFVAIEIYFGVIHQSLALVSDAIHNLTDVFGLVLAWLGYSLAKNTKHKKFSIYAAFINSSLILVTSGWVLVEAYERYLTKQMPVATTMMAVALVGCAINFFTAKLFHHDHHHDLNIKSAYLHLMADAAVSLGVVVAGGAIYYYGASWVDPLVSAVISVVIVFSIWGVWQESIRMLRGKTPRSIDVDSVRELLLKSGYVSVGGMRIWAISTSENAMRVQVSGDVPDKQVLDLKHKLLHKYRMTLVEFEKV